MSYGDQASASNRMNALGQLYTRLGEENEATKESLDAKLKIKLLNIVDGMEYQYLQSIDQTTIEKIREEFLFVKPIKR